MFDPQRIRLINAPFNLGLKQLVPDRVPGTANAPAALRRAGLMKHVRPVRELTVLAPAYDMAIDAETGIRNADAIRAYSLRLADVVEQEARSGNFLLVIGGDCSIVIGNMLGLRRLGRYGLIFIDGHTDYLTAETSATKAAAGMDLALVTGYGPPKLTQFDDSTSPVVAAGDVAAIGFRDVGTPETYVARALFDTDIHPYSLETLRKRGLEQSVDEALTHFEALNGFWVHLDVDVLDSEWMPAVDSPQPDGLSHTELTGLLRRLLASPKAVGMEITIFDPDLDPEGVYAQRLVQVLAESLPL